MHDHLVGAAAAAALLIPISWLLNRRSLNRLRRSEARARSLERWAEVAALAPVLVHDLKQPLSTLKVNLTLLGEDLDDIEGTHEPVERIRRRLTGLQNEIDRLEGILRDFRRYAGGMQPVRRLIDINTVVEELIDFFRPQAQQHRISIRTALSPSPLLCEIDPDRVKEALLNLFINAQQAMAEGGELMLRTAGDKWSAEVEVIDTGSGIAPELMPTLFRASFTTKRDGSGLGLPTVRRILDEHGARIEVHSEPGKGTRFTLTFPRGGRSAE